MVKKKGKAKRKNIYRIGFYLCIAGLAVCLFLGVRDFVARRRAEAEFERLAALSKTESPRETAAPTTEDETPTETEVVLSEEELLSQKFGIEIPAREFNWNMLREESEDIYAWIYVPGTTVDYPVLQHPTDDEYYLDNNLDGSTGFPGCIFTQRMNSKDFMDQVTVVYGHYLKTGLMFTSLREFKDEEFFKENPYIFIYTPERTLVYEIFSASVHNDNHIMYEYDFSTADGVEKYIEDLKNDQDSRTHVRDSTQVDGESHIVTLSTCLYKENKRWLVNGVLLNDLIEQ